MKSTPLEDGEKQAGFPHEVTELYFSCSYHV